MNYKQFPTIEIPAFLQAPEWMDASWGNDVTARSMRVLPADSNFELLVWVHPEKIEDRESPDYPRYAVVVYESVTGDELDSADANTESECVNAIDAFMANITLLLNNKLNWR